jgi:hypothetical protein
MMQTGGDAFSCNSTSRSSDIGSRGVSATVARGEFTAGYREGQEETLGALGLLLNVIAF